MSDRPEQNRPGPIDAITRIVPESGRWVVYLNVPQWDPDGGDDHPVTNRWQRINDYATEADAAVAAYWFERSANREIRPPSGF